MLYDPKWERQAETKTDPHSLESLLAWLEEQPATKEYDYYNCDGGCLIDQWQGKKCSFAEYTAVPQEIRYLAAGHPRTFGGALDRTRKLVAPSPQ